jgi:TolB-like protein
MTTIEIRRFASAGLLLIFVAMTCTRALAQDVDASMRALASSLAASLERSRLVSVTVLDLADLQGRPTELGRYLAQELSDKLVGASDKVSVVDRANLLHLLRENKLSIEGLINPETSRRLGKLVGVDSILVGSITPIGDTFRVNVRVIGVETGKVVGAQATNLSATRDLLQLSNRGVASAAPDQVYRSGAASGGGLLPAARSINSNLQTRLRQGSIAVSVKDIATMFSSSGSGLTVALDVANASGEPISMIYSRKAGFLVGTCQLRQTTLVGIGDTLYSTAVDARRAEADQFRLVQPGEVFTVLVKATAPGCDSLEDSSSAVVSFGLFVHDGKEGIAFPVRAEGPVRRGRK